MKWCAVVLVQALVVFCSGCAPGKTISGRSADRSQGALSPDQIEFYRGTWFSEDYVKATPEGDRTLADTWIELQIAGDGKSGTIGVFRISRPPVIRMAAVKSNWTLGDFTRQAYFHFDEDGFGNQGDGKLIFRGNKIILEIKVTHYEENSNFGVISGSVFRRPDNEGLLSKGAALWLGVRRLLGGVFWR